MNSVQVRTVLGAEVVEKRTREFRRRIRVLEDRKSVVQDRITARNYELDLLRGNRGANGGGKAGDKTREWKDLAQGAEELGRRIHELLALNRADSVAVREIDEEMAGLNREIVLSGSLQRDTTALDIDLTTIARGDVSITVSYVVRDVSWRASYEVALDSLSTKPGMNISLIGEVMQRTGEDWKDTLLVVSTERPAYLATPRTEQVQYNNVYRKKRAYSMPVASDGRSSAAPTSALELDEEPIHLETPVQVNGEYATRFKVAQPVTIKTGSEYRRVSLLEASTPCKVAVVIVPSGSPTAVLEASTVFKADQPLLPGTAQLFRDGEYVGTGNIGAVMSGEELRVNFGTDPSLRIARKAVNCGREEGWFNFGRVTRRYRWETTLKSGHASAWPVEVREQIPQTEDPDINIVPGEMSDGLLADDPEKPGLKRWSVSLEAGKAKKVVFEYIVKAPKGKSV